MGCTISIGSDSEQVWMINNDLYSRFAGWIEREGVADDETIRQITMSVYTNGLSLKYLESCDPMLTKRVVEILHCYAQKIAFDTGINEIVEVDEYDEEYKAKVVVLFEQLTSLLNESDYLNA